ncbi:hypothetical protein SAY87_024005 [Trapa incisa]|uniref:Uncharacterized protein n=1 Tax=Trapa incisa TaxID=236973 RepID=A0AAN7QQU2_9MYRT|nr:hypothetical protein SAY87_024005 [Trapa incisa]
MLTMEAKVVQSPQISTWVEMEKTGRRPSGSLHFTHQRSRDQKRVQMLISAQLHLNRTSNKQRSNAQPVSCSYKNFPGTCIRHVILSCFIESYVLNSRRKVLVSFSSMLF